MGQEVLICCFGFRRVALHDIRAGDLQGLFETQRQLVADHRGIVGASQISVLSRLPLGRGSGQPLLVIVSGRNRVNEAFGDLVGELIERATPDFVREATGYAIGRDSSRGP